MPQPIKELDPIHPNPPRWKPSVDPASIIVPGLDTTASVNDQIDQIDQLITLKLQDIDADFSKMQQVLSQRILPAFKRYSIGTEPVREAAKFWTSFYEEAAQVRIPTYDDFSHQEPSSAASLDEPIAVSGPGDPSIASGSNVDTFDPNRTPSEGSFLPAHAAASSTPAAATARAQGSPLVRLDRDLRQFARAEPEPASISSSIFSESDFTSDANTTVTIDETTRPAPAPAPSIIREPKHIAQTHVHRSYFGPSPQHLRVTRIVDLRSPKPTPSFSITNEDATLSIGMSPPVMVPFATLPTLGRSPAKSAAENIRHALVREGLRVAGRDPSISASGSGSSVPTPPSLARYTRGTGTSQSSASLELDSMMRRVGLGLGQNPQHWWDSEVAASAPASSSSTSIPDNALSTPSYYTTPVPPAPAIAHDMGPPETPVPASGEVFPTAGRASTASIEGVVTSIDAIPEGDDASTSTSTFSSSGEDSVHNTAHPSAAFLLASRQRGRHDYDDHDDDDDEPDDDGDFDDSLDADAAAARSRRCTRLRVRRVEGEEETLFGVRRAGREVAPSQLRMLGEDLLQDTMGIGTQLARAGHVEESPTPWGGGRGDGVGDQCVECRKQWWY
ncbi:DASH complex subunit Ask1-domain-containing protein [Lactifluus volemus]|nr:DASH complex subunit Ask1-domain-containing protein [Lactifluus volemus]